MVAERLFDVEKTLPRIPGNHFVSPVHVNDLDDMRDSVRCHAFPSESLILSF